MTEVDHIRTYVGHTDFVMQLSLVFASVTLALAGCSLATIRWVPDTDYSISIDDNPAQERFDLLLTSRASEAICLTNESWPGEKGLPPGFQGAQLKTSGGQSKLLPTGSAYCPGGCGELRIKPGQQVRGVIKYGAFGDPTTIAADKIRVLSFAPQPHVCTS